MEPNTLNTDFDFTAAMNAGVALAQETVLTDGADMALVPEGYKIQDLEKFHSTPRRIQQSITLSDATAFIQYVKRFKTNGTTVFADLKKTKFTAILDYSEDSDNAAWGEHQAVYNCPLSRCWETWQKADGEGMSQTDFAKFIEDNLPDIVEPDGSQILTIAKTLEAKKNVDFKSGVKLSNGETQFSYNEEIKGTSSGGTIEIPETFKLGIEVFEGGTRYSLDARLRYRISEKGGLTMWFDLLRPERLLDDAFKTLTAEINSELSEHARIYNAVAPN